MRTWVNGYPKGHSIRVSLSHMSMWSSLSSNKTLRIFKVLTVELGQYLKLRPERIQTTVEKQGKMRKKKNKKMNPSSLLAILLGIDNLIQDKKI